MTLMIVPPVNANLGRYSWLTESPELVADAEPFAGERVAGEDRPDLGLSDHFVVYV